MDKYGYRIEKYIKTSLVISIIDLIIFYFVGKVIDDLGLFHSIIDKWQYLSLFLAANTIYIYLIDLLFFMNRKTKYKLLFIKEEPFVNWQKYINKDIKISDDLTEVDFYLSIYSSVRDNERIKGIVLDEILIRDVSIHLLVSNSLLLLIFMIVRGVNYNTISVILLCNFITYIVTNMAYRKYLKYFITEIYKEYRIKKSTL